MIEVIAQIVGWTVNFLFGIGNITSNLVIPTPVLPQSMVTPMATPTLVPLGPTTRQKKSAEDPNLPTEWGVAKQVGEHTWTMRVGLDEKMASGGEIFTALNDYRRRFGVSELMWDEKLAAYAQTRADFFVANNGLDSHRGFSAFLENENGFEKLGFKQVGENSSMGYRMTGTHLIEWIFAGDEPHNKNQLNKDWAYVGIGVNQEAVDIIFGTGRY